MSLHRRVRPCRTALFLLSTLYLLVPCAGAADLRLDVQVIPRIGAFNHQAYTIHPSGQLWDEPRLDPADAVLLDRSRWTPRTWNEYLERAEVGLKDAFAATGALRTGVPVTAPQWDIITTSPVDSGYSHRRVRLRVPNAPGTTRCTFTLAGELGTPGVPCAAGQWFKLASNLAAPASVKVESGGAIPPQELATQVPEDFLIVAIGDSFLSGQGNPDGRQRSVKAGDCEPLPEQERTECFKGQRNKDGRALWMDERCQRSAWSLPIQVALRMIKGLPGHLGAVSVVSFACSGAKVSFGLNSPYEGQLSFPDFRSRMPSEQWSVHANTQLAKAMPLVPQKQAVVALLADQAKGGKTNVDLLLLDGGGNDVGFSSLVTDLVLAKSSGISLKEYGALLEPGFRALKGASYPDLVATLQSLPVNHAIALAYPDPTRVDDKQGCGGSPVDSAAFRVLLKVGSSVAGLALGGRPLDLRILPHEAKFAGENVLDPLNTAVSAFAASAGAAYVDQPKLLLRGKGWCATNTSDDPFKPSDRWIRTAEESLLTQGDVYGAMHPTWQYHEAASGQVAEFALQALARRPRVDFKAAVAGSVDGTQWVSSEMAVTAAGSGTYKICDGSTCQNSPAVFRYPHHASAPTNFRVDDTGTKYRTAARRSLIQDRVDAVAPQVSCRLLDRKRDINCEDVRLLSATSQLKLQAQDTDSGVATVRVRSGELALAEARADALTTTRQLALPDGNVEITVEAVDSVGNATSRTYSFIADTKPPQLESVNATPYSALAGAPPTFFAHRRGATTLTFVVSDAISGSCELKVGIQSARDAVQMHAADPDCIGAPGVAGNRTYEVNFRFPFSDTEEIELVQFVVFARDNAGNLADPAGSPVHRLVILPLVRCTFCLLSATQWADERLASEFQRVTVAAQSLGLPLPALGSDPQSEQAVVSTAWLNFLSGRYGSARTGGGKSFGSECRLVEAEGDAYASLANMRACLGQGHDLVAALHAMMLVPR